MKTWKNQNFSSKAVQELAATKNYKIMAAEKIKVTFAHENGDELICSCHISKKGTKINVTRANGEDVTEANYLLQLFVGAFIKGMGLIDEEEANNQ